MSWKLLPTNYADAVWNGLKKYVQVDNDDDTVSFQDVTAYTNRERSFFGAKDANRMNEAINIIMSKVENGTDLYAAFQEYFEEQKLLFEQKGKEELAKIDDIYKQQILDYENEQEDNFNAWFADLKVQLSENAAGNLYNKITEIGERVFSKEITIPKQGWKETTEFGKSKLYVDIPQHGITDKTIAFVNIHANFLEIAKECGMSSVNCTLNKILRLYADNNSTEDITATAVFLTTELGKTEGGGSNVNSEVLSSEIASSAEVIEMLDEVFQADSD